jgi:hypothetical protein
MSLPILNLRDSDAIAEPRTRWMHQ